MLKFIPEICSSCRFMYLYLSFCVYICKAEIDVGQQPQPAPFRALLQSKSTWTINACNRIKTGPLRLVSPLQSEVGWVCSDLQQTTEGAHEHGESKIDALEAEAREVSVDKQRRPSSIGCIRQLHLIKIDILVNFFSLELL